MKTSNSQALSCPESNDQPIETPLEFRLTEPGYGPCISVLDKNGNELVIVGLDYFDHRLRIFVWNDPADEPSMIIPLLEDLPGETEPEWRLTFEAWTPFFQRMLEEAMAHLKKQSSANETA